MTNPDPGQSTVITELDARLQLYRSERLETERLREEMRHRPPRPLNERCEPLRFIPVEKYADWWEAMRETDLYDTARTGARGRATRGDRHSAHTTGRRAGEI